MVLVEEVPTQSKEQHAFVKWITGDEEIVLAAATCIDVAHHDEEACLFKVEIGVNVYQRIVAYFHLVGLRLHGKLP